jgi:hypothetical protein
MTIDDKIMMIGEGHLNEVVEAQSKAMFGVKRPPRWLRYWFGQLLSPLTPDSEYYDSRLTIQNHLRPVMG